MTKKPFVGQSRLASDLLDLIYSDVWGPFNTQARGGFTYFITFTNDHSRIFHQIPEVRSCFLRGQVKQRFRQQQHHLSCLWFSENIPILRRSTRVSQLPERYDLLVTGQLDNNLKTFEEAMSDIHSKKWLEAMRSEMDSMCSNKVWTLVDPSKGFKPIVCNGEVATFKARLVAKCYTQKPSVDFEETYLPIVMAKSIRILLVISAYYDYEIWQMEVKAAFLNGFIKEEIYMDQSVSGSSVVFFVLYEDDILLIRNDAKMLGDMKAWLSMQFSMKDLVMLPTSLASRSIEIDLKEY
ncbi:UNVERIFIED_CONTAM: Copia protein [Sesamum latifolium]|uniref:Copia protein n=1 Tax=Sesamum latifolium TaxID=2727402 RepID=A0AAW2WUS7_9LAMI